MERKSSEDCGVNQDGENEPSVTEPSGISDDIESLQQASEPPSTETGTDTASIITTEGSQSFDLSRTEATEAVTDSDLVAATGNLKIRSKRTERLKRKLLKKSSKKSNTASVHLLDLPNEVLIDVVLYLLPSDIFRLSRTCHEIHQLVKHNESFLAKEIIAARYPILEKCFRLPIPLKEVDPAIHSRLQAPHRQNVLLIHSKYQHIPAANCFHICTCLTCVIRWNSLCNAVDFSYWQTHLEKGDPIPMMPRRNTTPEWNQLLVAKTNDIVSRALTSPLLHACILEGHLKNTILAIKRQSQNKGNQRRHFRMTQDDANSQTDEFLSRDGPVTIDLPFHRDNYYMLEAFMPSRTRLKEENRWAYMPADGHDRDLAWVAGQGRK
ncbi:F-box domain-containing protein [Colletotrichum karsti]|uniref:F-box domain-containing protein n=1 Tax=Colletotrichum karsti TaxID=1095194 RepID=A0A9P6I810_9PEZI|nr:F-box domain-containing protein [Colletotrichum karsti]KAF9873730.1 F-box domain-containing protein [Colletotrichum karsti]